MFPDMLFVPCILFNFDPCTFTRIRFLCMPNEYVSKIFVTHESNIGEKIVYELYSPPHTHTMLEWDFSQSVQHS